MSHATDLIDEMVSSNETQLEANDLSLMSDVLALELRLAAVREAFEAGNHIEGNWIREGAHKLEERVAKRDHYYKQRMALAYVREAAEPAATE